MKPSWLKSNCAIYTEQCDAAGPLRDLIFKLDQIKVILENGNEENKYNQHWKQIAGRINLAVCLILLATDVIVVGHYWREVTTPQHINWMTPE